MNSRLLFGVLLTTAVLASCLGRREPSIDGGQGPDGAREGDVMGRVDLNVDTAIEVGKTLDAASGDLGGATGTGDVSSAGGYNSAGAVGGGGVTGFGGTATAGGTAATSGIVGNGGNTGLVGGAATGGTVVGGGPNGSVTTTTLRGTAGSGGTTIASIGMTTGGAGTTGGVAGTSGGSSSGGVVGGAGGITAGTGGATVGSGGSTAGGTTGSAGATATGGLTGSGGISGSGGLSTGGATGSGGTGVGGTAGGSGGATGTCDGISCPDGCCEGTTCRMNRTDLLCGSAGESCAPCASPQTCQGGHCACPPNLSLCGSTCVNTQNNDAYCGNCTTACTSGQHCVGGSCVCDETICAEGCCNGKQCVRFAEQNETKCGFGGGTCGGCSITSPSEVACNMGRCLATLTRPSTLSKQITIRNGYAYFADMRGGIHRIPIGGGDPSTLHPTPDISLPAEVPCGLAVDATNVYWGIDGEGGEEALREVVRISINGGSVVPLASGRAQNVIGPADVALVGTDLYFTDSLGLMKVPTTSSGTAATLFDSGPCGGALATDGSNLYWQNSSTRKLVKKSIGGGAAVEVASVQDYAPYIVVVANNAYWIELDPGGVGVIKTVPTVGGAPTPLTSSEDDPQHLAVDGTYVYWTNKDGSVYKVPVGGGPKNMLVAAHDSDAWGIAVDATSVYWTEFQYGAALFKLTPK
jgi:hypothetical protein